MWPMKQLMRLILLLALMSPLLGGCGLVPQAGPVSFDLLARWVPGDAVQPFFLDLKPAGEAGARWERIRNRLEANSAAGPALDSLLGQFRVQDFGLESFIVGPAVNGYLNSTQYIILQVNSQSAARDAILLQNVGSTQREREEYQGKTLYHGMYLYGYGRREYLALATYDGLLFLASDYDSDPIGDLKTIVSLPEEQSLASLPTWKTLRGRLPEAPMGLVFYNVGDQLRQNPPPSSDTSLGTAFGQQLGALALAAVPEENGMRVEVAATLATQSDIPPEIDSLLRLPGVDPASWTGLPADAAIALSSRSAPTVWPILSDIFSIGSLDTVRDTVGLDLEADLFGVDGPLSGDFVVAITPPLPDQPISQGLIAGQLLFLARGTSDAQMATLQTAMQNRGAVLSSRTVNGVELQTQVGAELTGYAISFGFDDNVFLLGTSPGIVDRSVSARRDGNGLPQDPVFQAVLAAMPQKPSFFFYVNRPSLTDLVKANMTEAEYNQNQSQEFLALEAFDAVALGLKFSPDRIDGVLFCFVK
jgi:hypothetical protein